MKHSIAILIITLVGYCNCFAQEANNIEKIEMIAVDFETSFYFNNNLIDLIDRGLFVRIKNKEIIEKSLIADYLSKLNIEYNSDIETITPEITHHYQDAIKQISAYLVLDVYYTNDTTERYYLTDGIMHTIGNKIIKNKTVYQDSPELFKACYTFFPADYYWQYNE